MVPHTGTERLLMAEAVEELFLAQIDATMIQELALVYNDNLPSETH